MANADSATSTVTRLLRRAADGDRSALDELFSSLYPELKRVARARLYGQGRGDSMQTTMLVHESFLKLVQANLAQIQDRQHFFAYAAKTMRSIIIDSAREQLAERRGGGAEHLTLGSDEAIAVPDAGNELLRVNEALAELEALDPELAQVVELRYFGGYTEQEVADVLGVAERTVRRRWDKGRAWLFLALGGVGAALQT